jgi:hypothetical protein
MRENEFERKVQEQFDELHMRPSASVWSQVEKELQKKKRRRVVFYLSMLAGIGLLGYFSSTFLSNSISGESITGRQQSTSPVTDQKAEGNKSGTTTINTVAPGQSLVTTERPNSSLVDQQSTQPQETLPGKVIYNQKPAGVGTKGQLVIIQKAPPVKKAIPVEEKKITIIKDQDIPVIPGNETDQSIATKTQDEKATAITAADTVKKMDSAIAKTEVPEKEEPAIATSKKEPGKSRKVKWGFDLSAGVNFSRDKFLSLPSGNLAYADFNQSVDYSLNSAPVSGVGSNPFASPPVRPPSPVEAGIGFKAGLVAEVKLTEKSSLLTGVRYTYLSETIRVGSYTDTVIASSYSQTNNVPEVRAVNGYYGPQTQMRRNNYHFIELPLSYQVQLNKGKKMQVLWNGGVSAGYLLATNAVVYDTAARGIYYKDKKAFNKLHLNVISGLSFRFGDKNKLQWSVGPEFSMDMTRLLKYDVILKKRYLLYGGLTARFILPGKKK